MFLYSENCVKIGDFGFATTDAIKNSIEPTRPENETISTSTVLNKSLLDKQCGTTSYMAPELKEMINGIYSTHNMICFSPLLRYLLIRIAR